LAGCVEFGSQLGAIDGGGGGLQGAHVVDHVVVVLRELIILEADAATLDIARALEALPGIIDAIRDGLIRPRLRPDADDFDRLDGVASVARVVALAEAELLQAFSAESARRMLGAAGLLFEGAHGAHFEAGRLALQGLAPHRDPAIGPIQEVEVEEDPWSAGSVDLALRQPAPDGVAAARFGVDGHEPARIHEGRSPLGVEEGVEAARLGNDDLGHGGVVFRVPGEAGDEFAGLRIAQAPRIGGSLAGELFVAAGRARRMIVAGGDEAPAVAERIGGRHVCARIHASIHAAIHAAIRSPDWALICAPGEVRDRQAVLRGLSRPQNRSRLEAVAALVAVEPILRRGVGKDAVGFGARRQRALLGRFDPGLALGLGESVAALAHDLAGAPTTGQEVRCGGLADFAAAFLPSVGLWLTGGAGRRSIEPRPVALAVAVAREDFEQILSRGVVLFGAELVVETRARWRVDPPGETVGDHEAVHVPLGELCEEFGRCGGALEAIGGKLGARGVGRARRHGQQSADPPEEVRVVGPEQARHRLTKSKQQRVGGAVVVAGGSVGDGARRDVPGVEATQHHVLVAVVLGGRGSDLGPLPTQEGNEVGVCGVTR